MSRVRLIAGVLAVAVLTGGWLLAQDKKDDTTTKLKGSLPPNYKKIGLTDEQVQRIYKIQSDFKPQIDELKGKIKKLTADQDAEVYKVLTDDQKAALKKIILENPKAGGDKKSTTTETKKPEEKKKPQ
jgi:hypothetical protein